VSRFRGPQVKGALRAHRDRVRAAATENERERATRLEYANAKSEALAEALQKAADMVLPPAGEALTAERVSRPRRKKRKPRAAGGGDE
jgi:hypothetical protein